MSSKIKFNYNGTNTEIRCNIGDILFEICKNFCLKVDKDVNDVLFLYKGKHLNF